MKKVILTICLVAGMILVQGCKERKPGAMPETERELYEELTAKKEAQDKFDVLNDKFPKLSKEEVQAMSDAEDRADNIRAAQEQILEAQKQIEDVKQLIMDKTQEFEKRLKVLEDKTIMLLPSDTSTSESKESDKLRLVNCDYTFVSGEYHDYSYRITYIKLIDATILFEDLLGESLYAIKVNPDLYIPANTKKNDSGLYDVNQFISRQLRMKDMSRENVVVTLKVRRLVFDDNTIIKGE